MARKRTATDLDTAAAFRLPDAARKYSLGENTLRELIKSGRLRASKLGDKPRSPVIVTREAMDELFESTQIPRQCVV